MRMDPLTPADLKGRRAISYLRFSSRPQEQGTSIERQQATLDRVVQHFGLVLDQALEDRALSASKGHHRKRGTLGGLLRALREGQIERGTILVVEAVDRLFRERLIDAFRTLSDVVDNGMVIVIGRDLSIYCENGIERYGHKLVAEIQAAREYTDRLRDYALGASKKRRERIDAVAENPQAALPVKMQGRLPGWLSRDEKGFAVLNHHAQTIELMFMLAADGHTIHQITEVLNRDGVPTMDGSGKWRFPAVGRILRDEHAIGMHQQKRRTDGKPHSDALPLSKKARIYQPAITDDLWHRARDMLEGRNRLKGRKGRAVSNLFTGRVRCGTCGGAMRVHSSQPKHGIPRRDYVCAAYLESKSCEDGRRYDISVFEPRLVWKLTEMVRIAPRRGASAEGKRLAQEVVALTEEIKQRDASLTALLPLAATSPTILQQIETMGRETDGMRKRLDDVRAKAARASTDETRWQENYRMLRDTFGPAMAGDVDARERMRSLLARVEFKIAGAGPAMEVTVGERSEIVDPLAREPVDQDAEAVIGQYA